MFPAAGMQRPLSPQPGELVANPYAMLHGLQARDVRADVDISEHRARRVTAQRERDDIRGTSVTEVPSIQGCHRPRGWLA